MLLILTGKRTSVDHRPFRRDCAVCLEASAKQRPHYRQDRPSAFTMAMDVAGFFFLWGLDSDGKSKHRYLLVAVCAVPILQEGEFVWTEHKDAPIPPDFEFASDVEAPPDAALDPMPEEGEKARVTRVEEHVKTISRPIKVRTLILCEPLPSRRQGDVRLAAMRLFIRLTNAGCPVHRVHRDRARELMGSQLQTWFTEKGVGLSATIGKEPQSNGRAEVGIQVIKSHIRRMIKSGSIPAKFWPAVARHAAERIWRDTMKESGVPQPDLLACGTLVRARPRSWKNRGDPWRDRMVSGRVLSVAPLCTHGYSILLPDETVLLSFIVVAAPMYLVPVPPKDWERHVPSRRERGKSAPELRWIEVEDDNVPWDARFSPRGESGLEDEDSDRKILEGAKMKGDEDRGQAQVAQLPQPSGQHRSRSCTSLQVRHRSRSCLSLQVKHRSRSCLSLQVTHRSRSCFSLQVRSRSCTSLHSCLSLQVRHRSRSCTSLQVRHRSRSCLSLQVKHRSRSCLSLQVTHRSRSCLSLQVMHRSRSCFRLQVRSHSCFSPQVRLCSCLCRQDRSCSCRSL